MKITALFLITAAAVGQAAQPSWAPKFHDGPTGCHVKANWGPFDATKPKPINQITEEYCNELQGAPAHPANSKKVAVQTAKGRPTEILLMLVKVGPEFHENLDKETVDRDICIYLFKRVVRHCREELGEDLTRFKGGVSELNNGPWRPDDQARLESWSASIMVV